jgi:hypothetical protein
MAEKPHPDSWGRGWAAPGCRVMNWPCSYSVHTAPRPPPTFSSLPPPRPTTNVSLPYLPLPLMDEIDAFVLQPSTLSPLDVVDHQNIMNGSDPTATASIKLPRVKRSFKHVPSQFHFLWSPYSVAHPVSAPVTELPTLEEAFLAVENALVATGVPEQVSEHHNVSRTSLSRNGTSALWP